MRDCLDIFQFDCLVGQQSQRPASTPWWWPGATERHQVRFDVTINLALVLTRIGLALQRGFKAFCHKAVLDAVDLARAYV